MKVDGDKVSTYIYFVHIAENRSDFASFLCILQLCLDSTSRLTEAQTLTMFVTLAADLLKWHFTKAKKGKNRPVSSCDTVNTSRAKRPRAV